MKISPIAKFLTDNKATAVKDAYTKGLIRFYASNGEYLGFLRHKKTPSLSTININLYDHKREHPILKQLITVNRTLRYFLSEQKYMPVKIDIDKTIANYENKEVSKDHIGRGLAQDRYINEIPETNEELKEKRIKSDIPSGPVFEINKKPFKYEFKYHMYEPSKKIESAIPLIINKEGI